MFRIDFKTAMRRWLRRWRAKTPAARRLRLVVLCLALGMIAACQQDMADQPRYDTYEYSPFWDNRAASRPLPENTVSRGSLRQDTTLYTGRIGGRGTGAGTGAAQPTPQAGGTGAPPTPQTGVGEPGAAPGAAAEFDANLATTFPFPITSESLNRGQDLYQNYCYMCHGLTGYGDGMVVRRGYRQPPSFHDARLRGAPAGHFFDVISNGWGAMPSYGYLIAPRSRWEIAAYIRALQFAFAANLDDVPEAERPRLQKHLQGSRPQNAQPALAPGAQGGTRR
jgi:mono/diheme cytochrome c family protein